MERSERQAQIASHLTQVQLVVAMITGSASLLALVTLLLSTLGKLRPLSADAELVQVVLVPLAVVLVGIAPAVKRAFYKRAEAAGERGFGGDVQRWLAVHRTAVVVASALRESSAVLGFLMALLSGQARWSYIFSGLAVVSIEQDWPKAGDLDEG